MNNILIVEDEKNLGSSLLEFLQEMNFNPYWAKTCFSAKEYFKVQLDKNQPPSIVILDIGLPDGNGMDLAKDLRKLNKQFSFLFLSALNDPETRLNGLEIGAEDYIIKPFKLKELTLRLKKIQNMQDFSREQDENICHGALTIKFKSYEVIDATGKILSLTQKECEILQLLYMNKNNAVTRESIIEKVWGEDQYPSNRTVDNYIVKLRKWCETDPQKSISITSIRGIGYKLTIKE